MEVTFHNITVTLEAPTPTDAYTELCNVLAKLTSGEWTTDTYSVEGVVREPQSTEELFPKGI